MSIALAEDTQTSDFPTTEDVFGSQGLLARAFPGYVPRPGQVEMTMAVDLAYQQGKRLLVEGPTGTGKSVAYLVPAIRAYAEHARRTLVVTSNIALQEQLSRKDLPLLVRTLRKPFRFAMLKGVSNYLCREAMNDALTDPATPIAVRDLGAWMQETATGDLSELDHELEPVHRMKCTTSSDECLGRKCPSYDACFVQLARTQARAAHVVVVNYHLFFADLALRAEGFDGILPNHEAVILDEVHTAAEIARSFFGWKITRGAIDHVVRRLLNVNPGLAKDIQFFAEDFFRSLDDYRQGDQYRARLKVADPVPSTELREALLLGAKALRDEAEEEPDEGAKKKLEAAAERADTHALRIKAAMSLTDAKEHVYAIEPPEGQKSCALVAQPIDVGPLLQKHLWGSERLATVVGTSATIGDGRSLDLVAREVGAEAARQLIVPSPFDWANQARLVIPPDLPEVKDKEWPEAVCARLLEACEAARGRTLGLFTSYKMMRQARDFLRNMTPDYAILCQGDAPRTKLVEEFRRDVSSVLLGTASLWEGVDVQGEALSCVVIDKLPFGSPDDPITSVMEERRGKRWWKEHSLPKAVIDFRQGAGRLIRTATDKGVIVVLDDRIVSKPYGRAFIRGLPDGVPVWRGEDWADRVRAFLQ